MTTFLEAESSEEDSDPRECYEIIFPTFTYRLTSGDQDVTFGSETYYAGPIARGEVGVSSITTPRELIIILPVSHDIPQRYNAGGIPPRLIVVKVWRYQASAGTAECVWSGKVTSMACEGHTAKLRVLSVSGMALARRLPTITTGKDCPHMLFDVNCKVVRADYAIEAIVTTFSGREVTINALGGHADAWAQWGDLLHLDSGERMTIQTQVGLVITMQLPIYGLSIGDHVVVSPGCSHGIATGCRDKFRNVLNFGGQPDLPSTNPMFPNGFGIFQSE